MAPCHKCTARELGCHSTCRKYADYKSGIVERQKIYNSQWEAMDLFIRGCEKRKRARAKRKRRR